MHDESLEFLLEAQSYIDSFVEISLADSFFQETEELKKMNEENEKAKKGALDSLKKAFDALIKMIRDAINSFTEFIKEKMLSSDEKKRYKEFKEMIKNNPELANTKVTIDDFKVYEKVYDDAIKALEEECKKEDPDEAVYKKIISDLGEKLKKVGENAKDIASRAGLSTTLATAVEIADSNVACAKAINIALKTELISLEEVQKQLGEKEAAKFEKKISRYAKNGLLHRGKVFILRKKKQTLESILKKQFNKLLSFTNANNKDKPIVTPDSIAKGIVKNPKLASDALGGPTEAAKAAKNLVSTSASLKVAKHEGKRMAKRGKKEAKEFLDFVGIKGKK